MTRALFLTRLRQGLGGLSPDEIDEIAGDYDAHFSDAIADGRTEADVAASLGDPAQLGRELAAETKLRRWESRRNPGNFLRAGLALTGLQTFSIFILLPVIAGLALCAGIAAYVLYVVAATGLHLTGGLLSGNGNVLVPALVGLGLVCGVVAAGALIALMLDSGLRILGHTMRQSYRLLKPGDKDEE
jgi:uncharacterized membrane protein